MSTRVSLFQKTLRIVLVSLLFSLVVFFSILFYTSFLFESVFFAVISFFIFLFFFSFLSLFGYVYYPVLVSTKIRTYDAKATYVLADQPFQKRIFFFLAFFLMILFFLFFAENSVSRAGFVLLLFVFLLLFYFRIPIRVYAMHKGIIFDYASFKELIYWDEIASYQQRGRQFYLYLQKKQVVKSFLVQNARLFSQLLQKKLRTKKYG